MAPFNKVIARNRAKVKSGMDAESEAFIVGIMLPTSAVYIVGMSKPSICHEARCTQK